MFSKATRRDSQDFAVFPLFFPMLYLLDGEDNCVWSVPITFTIVVCKVAKTAWWCPPGLSRCCSTLCGSLWRVAALLVSLCCLAHASSARRFPFSWPGTVSFRSCLLLPPGSLETREAGICALNRALSSSSFFSIGSPRLTCSQWFQAAFEKYLFKRWWNLKALQLREIV